MTTRADGRAGREFLLLGLAILLFYGVLLWAPLIYDDRVFILADPRVTGPWGGWRAALFLPGEHPEAYEPAIVLLHRFLFGLSGDKPFLYRLTSLLLHWVDAGLVLALYHRFIRDKRLAFLAALLFAVFPAHSEVLAVSTFKKHLLVAFCSLASLWLLERRSWKPSVRVAGLWGLFALALACKESALIVPALAGAWILQRRPQEGRPGTAETSILFGGWAALLAGYAAVRAGIGIAPHALEGGNTLAHLSTSSVILCWYLGHLALPVPLSIERSLLPVTSLSDARAWLGAVVAFAVIGGLFLLYRRDRKLWFAAAWIILALAPFLNLIPSLNYSLAADRYLYIASIGFFLLVALALERLAETRAGRSLRSWATPALLALAVVYGCAGIRYASLFSDPRELWENAVLRAPLNPRSHFGLGAALKQRGENSAAAVEYRRAIALDPDYADAYLALAEVDSDAGRSADAVADAAEAVRRRPDASSWQALGVYRLRAGQVGPALDAFREAAALSPNDPELRLKLGFAAIQAKRWDEAVSEFRAASADPKTAARAAVGLGRVALAMGKPADGAKLFAAAQAQEPWDPRRAENQALDPWNPEIVENLARYDVSVGKMKEAAALYDQSIARLDSLLAAVAPGSVPELAVRREDLRRKRAALSRP